jgi:hypothetical protein
MTFTQQVTAAGSNYGIVMVWFEKSVNGSMVPNTTSSTVTFGGVTMTRLQAAQANNVISQSWLAVFGAANIPSGSQTVSVTLTQSSNTFYGYLASFTYNNVASVTSSAYVGANASPSNTVSVKPYTTVWSAIGEGMGGLSNTSLSNFSLTQRQSISQASLSPLVAGDLFVPASQVVVGATSSVTGSTRGWVTVAVNMIA